MYTIYDLAAEFNISVRAIRRYKERGALSPALGQNRWAYYTDKHYRQLREILRVKEYERTTLADLAVRHGNRD